MKITDYKGWARGLKKAGYATDPRYADRLINIIELYDLDRYDTKKGLEWIEEFPNPHQPYLANDMVYIIARRGDTFENCRMNWVSARRNCVLTTSFPRTISLWEGKLCTWRKTPSGYEGIHCVRGASG